IPGKLARIYLSDTASQNLAILKLTQGLLAITALSQCFDGLRNVFTGAYRGLQRTKIPMIIGSAYIWLLSVPLYYCFCFLWDKGVLGIRLCFTMGIMFASIALIFCWYKEVRAG